MKNILTPQDDVQELLISYTSCFNLCVCVRESVWECACRVLSGLFVVLWTMRGWWRWQWLFPWQLKGIWKENYCFIYCTAKISYFICTKCYMFPLKFFEKVLYACCTALYIQSVSNTNCTFLEWDCGFNVM